MGDGEKQSNRNGKSEKGKTLTEERLVWAGKEGKESITSKDSWSARDGYLSERKGKRNEKNKKENRRK